MTVEKENEDGPKEYYCIRFVEFLEFIGRIGLAKFKDTEMGDGWDLHKKCFEVLICIFRFIGEKPIDPDNADINISDSDDDY